MSRTSGNKKPLPIVHSGGKWIGPKKVVLTDLYEASDEYLVRYILFRTPWFGVQVHRINRADSDRDMHNHPRAFWSIILRGGYDEERDAEFGGRRHHLWRQHRVGSINRMKLKDFHSIRTMVREPTWTLVIVGPARQKWGFLTEHGFIEADLYPDYVDSHQ